MISHSDGFVGGLEVEVFGPISQGIYFGVWGYCTLNPDNLFISCMV